MEKALLVFVFPKTGEILNCFRLGASSVSASIERLATEGLNGFGKAGSAGTLWKKKSGKGGNVWLSTQDTSWFIGIGEEGVMQ